jgi:hypothetical protein
VLIGESGHRVGEARARRYLDGGETGWAAWATCLPALWYRSREAAEQYLCSQLLGIDCTVIAIIDRRKPRQVEPEQLEIGVGKPPTEPRP